MNYKYYLYGLNVASEIDIEEAFVRDFSCEPDVRVIKKELPLEVQRIFADKGRDEHCIVGAGNQVAFRIGNVGEYCISADVIIVNVFETATTHEIDCFLLGSAFGFCMILRKMVVLHGGALAYDGRGVIITGDSGAGKSTVSDILLSNGYKFVADDVCAISVNSGRPHVNMAYPQQKLCRDAAVKKGYDLSKLIYINEHRDKFAIRLKDGFLAEGADLSFLFEIMIADSDELKINEVKGFEKLNLLMRNIYKGEDGFNAWGIPPEYMKGCLDIVSGIEVYQIVRPAAIDTLEEIVGFIEEKVRGI